MRVSKADGSQTTDLQRDALLAAGIDADSLYEDRASGKKDDRPHLAACLRALRYGDTLVVWNLDRLGRDLRHLINIVHELTDAASGSRSSPGRARPSTPPQRPENWPSVSSPPWPSLNASSSPNARSLGRPRHGHVTGMGDVPTR